MTKQEFLEELCKALGSRVNSSVVNENITYYEEYIATQVRAGRSEESVIEKLGDPRLLARSIADADKRAGGTEAEDADETRGNDEHPMRRIYNLPGWVILVGVILIVVLVLSAVFKVIGILLPILIRFLVPVAIVIFFLRLLKRK